MKRIKTDMMALACILGGAVGGGALTAAFLHGGAHSPADCTVETTVMGPRILVTGAEGARAVVLSTPHMEMNTAHHCSEILVDDVTVHLEDVRRNLDVARVQLEQNRARLEATRGVVVRVRELQASQAEAQGAEAEAEARLGELKAILEKVEKESGGRMD